MLSDQTRNSADREPVRGLVAVMGLGYVGMPVAEACVDVGFRVVGVDINAEHVASLRQQTSSPDLSFTTDASVLADADVVFICVPTPTETGEAQHRAVRACAEAFATHGRADTLVILESTVRPGFVRELQPLLGHGGRVALAYAPERIDPARTSKGWLLHHIPRLVAGVDDIARARAIEVFHALGVTVHPVSLAVAERAKLLENAYRLLNVAFIDEFAAACRAEGVDPREVIQAAATKPFGYQPFYPGVGAGGHCIVVDPVFLVESARALGVEMPVLLGALAANTQRPRRVAAEVAAETAPGASILVVGLTYKAGVADIRESAALTVARTLSGMNRRVLAFDAIVEVPDDLEAVSLEEGLSRADAVVLLVAQPATVMEKLQRCLLPLFDATGSLAGAVEI